MGRLPGWHRLLAGIVAAVMFSGCAFTTPYTGQGPHPQIERGAAIPVVDTIGNFFGLLSKLILWDRRMELHKISPETEAELVHYLDSQDLPAFEDTKYRLNQYRPLNDLKRLVKNKHVAWPYRLLLGFPVTLIFDVLPFGRLGLVGDRYNPYTNTVFLYSDHSAVALHEAGHSHDFATRRFKGTYALIRIIPFVDLFQEFIASDEAIQHFVDTAEHENEIASYKILYPAYGTYVGSYFYIIAGPIVGAIIGHILGRSKAAKQKKYYEELEAEAAPAEPAPSEPVPTQL